MTDDLPPLRLVLDAEQSAACRAVLDGHPAGVAVLGLGSYPDAAGKVVLYLIPASVELASDAIAVAMGERRSVKSRATRRLPRATGTDR